MIDSFPERAGAWLQSHDTGLSSLAIFHYMTLRVRGGATPCDGGDLGRCVRLIDHFPEFAARMPEMARTSDDWAALMPIWVELVAAYREDIKRPRGENWRSDEMLRDLWWDRSSGVVWVRRNHGFKAAAA